MKAPEMRLVFSCPKCSWRRKTYIENEDLYIKCRKCGHKFVVGNGSNPVYVEAHNSIPESARDYYVPCEDEDGDVSEEEMKFKKIKNIIHVILLIAFHVWLYVHFFT